MLKKMLALFVASAITLGVGAVMPESVSLFGNEIEARAETFGDFEYRINNEDIAVITEYTGNDKSVTIPSTIDGKNVELSCLGKRIPTSQIGVYNSECSIEIINIPQNVSINANNAFRDCPNLKEINVLPNEEEYSEYGYFSENGVLFQKTHTQGLYYDTITEAYITEWDDIVLRYYPNGKEDTQYSIPDYTTSCTCDFNNDYLEVLNIPKGIRGMGAYIEASNMYKINVDSDNTNLYSIDGVLYAKNTKTLLRCPQKKNAIIIPSDIERIESCAFYKCNEIQSIIIPDSVTTIGTSAFKACNNLQEVKIGTGVKEIGQEAFSDCVSLIEIELPENATIYQMTFQNCTNLVKVKLPKNTYSLSCNFYNCSRLKEIEVPDSVTKIYKLTFLNCMDLKRVTVLGVNTDIEENALGYYYDNNSYEFRKIAGLTIYCYPNSKAEKYAKDNGFNYVLLTPDHTHSYTTKIVKPTYEAEGYTLHTCSVCGESYKDNIKPKLTRTSIAKATVSGFSNKTYTGKAITQTPVVKLGTKTLKSGTDYTVSYKNNKAVGTATVTITGKGAYNGTVSKTFKICPKKTAIKKVTSPKTKQIKVTYGKVAGVTGYQITYSTSSKFTAKTTKTASSTGTSKTISKLTKGKTYYVKVRTYKTVGKTKYYSGYTAVKKIKIK